MAEVGHVDVRPPATSLFVLPRDLPLWVGLALLAVPTLQSLGGQVWTKESGAHGPIVLAVGAWLLAREFPKARPIAKPGALWATAVGLLLSLSLYVFGRAFDFISLEV